MSQPRQSAVLLGDVGTGSDFYGLHLPCGVSGTLFQDVQDSMQPATWLRVSLSNSTLRAALSMSEVKAPSTACQSMRQVTPELA